MKSNTVRLYKQLLNVSRLPDDWDDSGGKATNKQSAENARLIYSCIHLGEFAAFEPGYDDAGNTIVCLCWYSLDKCVEIKINIDNTITFDYYRMSDEWSDGFTLSANDFEAVRNARIWYERETDE